VISHRRTFLKALGGAPGLLSGARAASRRPNIVLIMADDLGSGDLSSYGCPDIRTPHIDSIGRRGVRFSRFYANAPECTPTRTALLTGRYQQRVGGLECAIGVGDQGRYDEAMWLQKRGDLGLPVSETSMPRMLQSAGYDTGCFGKWHLGYPQKFWPIRHGFDESFGILGGNADYFTHKEQDGRPVLYRNDRLEARKGYVTDLITEEALGWLKRRGSAPFFLYVPFTTPHTPIQDPDGFDPTTGTARWQQGNRAVYAKMVERMDRGVGEILAQIERMGAAERTIVVYLSDNGGDSNGRNAPLRGRKSSVWEGGIRVPCMVRWPGVLSEGRTVSQVGLSMDLLPTFLAAAGAQAPAGRKLDGVDLLPVMAGKRQPFSRTVFWRYKRANNRRKAVLHGSLKLVMDNDQQELHDLSTDEPEKKDLLPTSPAIAQALKDRLAAWEREVAAPRLRDFRPGAA
jgi:N-acetylgalactosamine-6-sulfatase